MSVGLSALRDEILSNPAGLSYTTYISAGAWGNVALVINSISANSGLPIVASTVTVGTVYAIQMQQCVVATEYGNLPAVSRDLWGAVITTALNGIAVSNSVIRGQITAIWSAGTDTRSNLVALQTRPASRCEVLFGEGATATTDEVSKAIQGDF